MLLCAFFFLVMPCNLLVTAYNVLWLLSTTFSGNLKNMHVTLEKVGEKKEGEGGFKSKSNKQFIS